MPKPSTVTFKNFPSGSHGEVHWIRERGGPPGPEGAAERRARRALLVQQRRLRHRGVPAGAAAHRPRRGLHAPAQGQPLRGHDGRTGRLLFFIQILEFVSWYL